MEDPHLARRLQVLTGRLARSGARPSLGTEHSLRGERPVVHWVDGPTRNEVRLLCARVGVTGVALQRTAGAELLAATARREGSPVNGAKLLSAAGNVPYGSVEERDRLLARAVTAELSVRPRGGDLPRVLAEATALVWNCLGGSDTAVLETAAQLLLDCPDQPLVEVARAARTLAAAVR